MQTTQPTADVPNLDAMTHRELMEFWRDHQGGRAARELFPNGGPGTKAATADLANYAANKATAMQQREHGNIERALDYERIADNIYNDLPQWARW